MTPWLIRKTKGEATGWLTNVEPHGVIQLPGQ